MAAERSAERGRPRKVQGLLRILSDDRDFGEQVQILSDSAALFHAQASREFFQLCEEFRVLHAGRFTVWPGEQQIITGRGRPDQELAVLTGAGRAEVAVVGAFLRVGTDQDDGARNRFVAVVENAAGYRSSAKIENHFDRARRSGADQQAALRDVLSVDTHLADVKRRVTARPPRGKVYVVFSGGNVRSQR